MTFNPEFLKSITDWVAVPRDDGLPPWESGGGNAFGVGVNVEQGQITVDHVAMGEYGTNGLDDVEVLRKLEPGESFAVVRDHPVLVEEPLLVCLSEDRIMPIKVLAVCPMGLWFQFDAPEELAKYPQGESGSPIFDSENRLAGMIARWWPATRVVEAISHNLIKNGLAGGYGG